MVLAALLLLVGMSLLFTYGTAGTGFLPGFARLLDHAEFAGGFGNLLIGRSFVTGEFRGRKVMVLVQHGNRSRRQMVVVSMETRTAASMDTYDFAGYRTDREGELALFALEAKHELVLRLQDGCLKALWEPFMPLFLPGSFQPAKWQSVLEAMHSLAGSLERRAPSPVPSASR